MEGGKEFCMPCLQINLVIQITFRHTNSEKQKTTCEILNFIGAAQLLHLLSLLPESTSECTFHVLVWEVKLTE